MGPFTQTHYMICHGRTGVIHFTELEPGQVLETGQPICEDFTDRNAAIERAMALGYVFDDDEDDVEG